MYHSVMGRSAEADWRECKSNPAGAVIPAFTCAAYIRIELLETR